MANILKHLRKFLLLLIIIIIITIIIIIIIIIIIELSTGDTAVQCRGTPSVRPDSRVQNKGESSHHHQNTPSLQVVLLPKHSKHPRESMRRIAKSYTSKLPS